MSGLRIFHSMRQLTWIFALLAAARVFAAAPAKETSSPMNFTEVRALILTNLPGIAEQELNRAALAGMLADLKGRVELVGSGDETVVTTNLNLLSKAECLESNVAYLRVETISAGLAEALTEAQTNLLVTNPIVGVVLDLRFAQGTDFAAAQLAAKQFHEKLEGHAAPLPLAILVNHETRGAAELLAAELRAANAGLILGQQTAGQACQMREFKLKTGQRLLVASSPVKLSNGKELSGGSVTPDVMVSVNADDERAYFEDPYTDLSPTNALPETSLADTSGIAGTELPSRKRMSEAELVRKHREGTDMEDLVAAEEISMKKPVLSDPALARAVDLVKGLALVRSSKIR